MKNPFRLVSPSHHTTNREDFVETWLWEMPQGISPQNYYPNLVINIQERIESGIEPQQVDKDLWTIVGREVVHYWFGSRDHVILGSELNRRPQGLVVAFTAKDPQHKGGAPYASDLYVSILNHSETPIRLMSDETLSNEGLGIWQRLLEKGSEIWVYDKHSPGTARELVKNLDDLKKYFRHDDPNFRRYQYVLLQPGSMISEMIGMFNTRRLRELAGIL